VISGHSFVFSGRAVARADDLRPAPRCHYFSERAKMFDCRQYNALAT
jgi:hypothetical protein